EVRARYFFVFFLASARRSVFFRRLARFFALSLPLLFPIILNSVTLFLSSSRTYSGREVVDRSVAVVAPVDGGAVKVSEPVNDHTVIGESAVRRTFERMNYRFDPLTVARRA